MNEHRHPVWPHISDVQSNAWNWQMSLGFGGGINA